jgi:hypothetical protein
MGGAEMIVSKELVSRYDPSKAYDGYTLFGPMGSKDVYLVDMQGRFVHHWHMHYPLGLHGRLLPNGNLLVGQRIPTGPVYDLPGSGGELLEIDWDGNVVWKYEDLYMNSHDFDRMENGHILISHWEAVPDEIAAQVKGGAPESEREGVIWGDRLLEINSDGEVMWDWLAYEHMDFERDVLCPLCSRDTLTYVNSVAYMRDGNILINNRILDTVAIIDKSTGDIVWRWGPGEIAHAHNATQLDNGNILVFDNGLHRMISELRGRPDISYSQVVEVDVETKETQWEYQDENPFFFYSAIAGGAQRLPNGNTLICESTKGRIFEVTAGKEIVWEFTNPFYTSYRGGAFGTNNLVFRAYRYASDYDGLRGKTLDPDRFEWILHEKGKAHIEEGETPNDTVKRRLRWLGY